MYLKDHFQTNILFKVRVNGMIEVGDDKFFIKSLKGEGGFAKVFSAIREDDDMNCTIAGIDAVLKVSKCNYDKQTLKMLKKQI